MAEIIASLNTCNLIKEYLPSNQDIADMCSFFLVFCDVTRVRMLSALSIDELCVGDIATLLNLNQTTVSHQLKILRDAGLVTTRREGKIIFYRVASEHVETVMNVGAGYLLEILPPSRKNSDERTDAERAE